MHIDNLPKELRELALLRREQEKNKKAFTCNEYLNSMFEWQVTIEGPNFWIEVYEGRNIMKHNEYAKSILASSPTNYEIY